MAAVRQRQSDAQPQRRGPGLVPPLPEDLPRRLAGAGRLRRCAGCRRVSGPRPAPAPHAVAPGRPRADQRHAGQFRQLPASGLGQPGAVDGPGTGTAGLEWRAGDAADLVRPVPRASQCRQPGVAARRLAGLGARPRAEDRRLRSDPAGTAQRQPRRPRTPAGVQWTGPGPAGRGPATPRAWRPGSAGEPRCSGWWAADGDPGTVAAAKRGAAGKHAAGPATGLAQEGLRRTRLQGTDAGSGRQPGQRLVCRPRTGAGPLQQR
ncbi:hypothetical protein D9M71_296780 [compost metagenome]